MAAALGLVFGWPDVIVVIALGFILGAVAALYLMLRRGKTGKDFLPFGPFLVLAALLVFFFGQSILQYYFTLAQI